MASKLLIFPGPSPERIDRYLAGQLGISRERIKSQIARGEILVNGRTVANSHKLHPGEQISVVEETPDTAGSVPAESAPLDIIFEDELVIVLNKPAGVLTHPTVVEQRGTLINHLLAHTNLSSIGAPLRPGVVHRLDRETSGAIVFAKTDRAYWNIVAQFKNRQVEKTYYAVVEGKFRAEETAVEFALMPSRDDPTKMEVRYLHGKKALTKINLLKYENNLSLLEVKPITGRTHQIRLTLAWLGFPILGDSKYGKASTLIPRTALHAWSLSFLHPSTNERLSFTAAVPSDISALLPV